MQHKRQHSRLAIFLLAFAGMVIGGAVVLMTMEIAPPARTIEKELDAKTFLENR